MCFERRQGTTAPVGGHARHADGQRVQSTWGHQRDLCARSGAAPRHSTFAPGGNKATGGIAAVARANHEWPACSRVPYCIWLLGENRKDARTHAAAHYRAPDMPRAWGSVRGHQPRKTSKRHLVDQNTFAVFLRTAVSCAEKKANLVFCALRHACGCSCLASNRVAQAGSGVADVSVLQTCLHRERCLEVNPPEPGPKSRNSAAKGAGEEGGTSRRAQQ